MACLLDGLSHFALVLQRSAREAAGEDFALLVAKHQQKVRILVVDVLDALHLEAAVLLLLSIDVDRIKVAYVLVSHDRWFRD